MVARKIAGKTSAKKPAAKSKATKKRRSIINTKRTVKKTPLKSKKKVLPNVVESSAKEYVSYQEPVAKQVFPVESNYELPNGYGDNRIVAMVRDPYWLYAYWEVNQNRIKEISSELGDKFSSSSLVLRVYDISSSWSFFDVKIDRYIGSWYVNVGRPNTSFCIDVGFVTSDGYFVCAARSNIVLTPRDRMSEIIDEEWMIPDWEMMYALSGGFAKGKSSLEIRDYIEKMRIDSPSSWISSISSPVRKEERPFWLTVNCELIVYGATEPSASVTVQGRPVNLREDGTFSLRFSLPDGKQEIPVEAVRDDGKEKRKITPIVGRRTE